MKEVVDEDVVAANGEEETEEEPADRDTDVAEPKENVGGEVSTTIHMINVRIQVVSEKHKWRNMLNIIIMRAEFLRNSVRTMMSA